MKTALLLEKLEGQLATLRQRCAPVAQFATLSARFDRHLFQTRATTLQACLDEAGDNLAAPLSNSNCRKSPGWRNIWRRNWRL